MEFIYSFLFAGIVCLIGQIILDNTKLLPGHITSLFVVIGAALDTFSIYDLIEYKKILEKLKQESEMAISCGNIKRKKFFDEYIKELSFGKLDVIRKDSSNKVLIPNCVKDMYDIEDRVLVCNGVDHIKVFKNDDKKREYEKRLINIFK
mgnify:FL=1